MSIFKRIAASLMVTATTIGGSTASAVTGTPNAYHEVQEVGWISPSLSPEKAQLACENRTKLNRVEAVPYFIGNTPTRWLCMSSEWWTEPPHGGIYHELDGWVHNKNIHVAQKRCGKKRAVPVYRKNKLIRHTCLMSMAYPTHKE